MPFDLDTIQRFAQNYGYQKVNNKNKNLVSYKSKSIKLSIYYTGKKNTVAVTPTTKQSGNGQRFVFPANADQLHEIFRNPLNEYKHGYCSHREYKTKQNTKKRSALSLSNTDDSDSTHSKQLQNNTKRKRNFIEFNQRDPMLVPTKRIKYTPSSTLIHDIKCNPSTNTNEGNLSQIKHISVDLNEIVEDIDDIQEFDEDIISSTLIHDHIQNKHDIDSYECTSQQSKCNTLSTQNLITDNGENKHITAQKQFDKLHINDGNLSQDKHMSVDLNEEHADIEDIQEFDDDIFLSKATKMNSCTTQATINLNQEEAKEQIPCDHIIDYRVFKGDELKTNYCSVLEKQVRAAQKDEYQAYKKYLKKMNQDLSKKNTNMEKIFAYELAQYDYTQGTKQIITFASRKTAPSNNHYKKYNKNYNNLKAHTDVLLFCSCALQHDVLQSGSDTFYESLLRNGRILSGRVVNIEDEIVIIRIKTFCAELDEFSTEYKASETKPSYHDKHSCRFSINEDKFKFITFQIQLRGIETFLEQTNNRWFEYFYTSKVMQVSDKTCTNNDSSQLQKEHDPNANIVEKYAHLNLSQQHAICNSVQHACSLIQGPPGTGKTYTACHIIDHLLSQNINQRILMTAHTHCAVDQFLDEFVNRFAKYKERVTRMGAPSNVRKDENKVYCLDNKIKQFTNEYKQMQDLFTKARAEKRDQELRSVLRKQAMEIKDVLCKRALQESAVILGTCYGCCNKYLVNLNPVRDNTESEVEKKVSDAVNVDCILFDESTQIHEPEMMAIANCLYPYTENRRIIMIGDPKQLSPITRSKESEIYGYNLSIFERLLYKIPIPNLVETLATHAYSKEAEDLSNFVMLNVQYRGYDVIHDWSNKLFYGAKLMHDQKFNDIRKLIPGYKWKNNLPINFLHLDSKQEAKDKSFINEVECDAVVDIAINIGLYHHHNRHLLDPEEDVVVRDFSEIGIITPHKPQQQLIVKKLWKRSDEAGKLNVSTVDAFQGQQKKLIIYSVTRTDAKATSFMRNAKRINVAFTRSKYGLLVVGNLKQLRINVGFWRNFKQYLDERNVIDQK